VFGLGLGLGLKHLALINISVLIIIIIIILFAREQYSKQVQMTVEMSRTIRRKDTHCSPACCMVEGLCCVQMF